MIDYETIKAMAKEAGMRVGDLIALDAKNDPFYTGRPSELSGAAWFKDIWERHCEARQQWSHIHLRRIHYWAIDLEPPLMMPDGRPYENTERCWNYLTEASKWARYLGYVNPAAFEDRQAPKAELFAYYSDELDATPHYHLDRDSGDPFEDDYGGYDLPDLPELPNLPWHLPYLPGFTVGGYEDIEQPYHVEVWIEKTTMNDILVPICRRYRVNLVNGKGELSITAVIEFLRRARQADRPSRILYISDYDPAGMGMPISVARKVEFYQRSEGFGDLDIRLEQLILTARQVATYNLPRKPIKDSELRKAGWEALHGTGATELDALEGRHPGEMARIVEDAILSYYDKTLYRRAIDARGKFRDALRAIRDGAAKPYQDELDAIEADYDELRLDFAETRRKFDELIEDFQPEIDAHNDALEAIKERYRDVYGKLYTDMQAVEIDAEVEYPLPEAELPEESKDLLYASDRDYLEQLAYYNAHRGNGA